MKFFIYIIMSAISVGEIEVGSMRLNFWDLGGQEDLRSLWHQYFEDCHALIFVVDSCDVGRFKNVAKTFGTFFFHLSLAITSLNCLLPLSLIIAFSEKIMDSETVQQMPVLVVCNKSDLEDCASVEEISRLTTDDRHIGDFALVPVSALQGLNVNRCIRWLCAALKKSNLPTL